MESACVAGDADVGDILVLESRRIEWKREVKGAV